jgi:hypothetical protein
MGSSPTFQRTYECDLECCELAAMTIASEGLAAIRVATIKGAPDSKRPVCSFEPTENTKEVPINPTGSDGKVLCIGSDLSPK